MLTILGNGKSLSPFVVFIGKPNSPKIKKFRTHSKVVLGYIYVSCQENSWIDENTMKAYLKKYGSKKVFIIIKQLKIYY